MTRAVRQFAQAGQYSCDVSDLTIPVVAAKDGRPGQGLRLTSLAPRFDESSHRLYVDLLQRAIDEPGTRNIALTGAYGTGKSSILDELRRELDDGVGKAKSSQRKILELSLSTIAPEVQADGEDPKSSRTNQIQKEIVKQLLYRLPPRQVPQSRFNRSSVPRARTDWIIASSIAGTALLVALVLGVLQPLVQSLLVPTWRQFVAYIVIFLLGVGMAWIAVKLTRSRPVVSASLGAGPSTVSLSPKSETYFDEYLDEIVYFFEASQSSVVVIEDIDRFEDVQIFDTLRALNGLLNGSEQIGRRIVFIYAIRDSVFEQIGSQEDDPEADLEQGSPGADPDDKAKHTLKRASRTKFFDVIIPVVPFVSADNARDLMASAMESDQFEIDRSLIRLAARHVADMRLIHNIRNEFEIYRQRLVVPDARLPDITDDLVFAMVLYKNSHLADFESIRYRDSSLDRLYRSWRQLLSSSISVQVEDLGRIRSELHAEASKGKTARRLTEALEQFKSIIRTGMLGATSQATVELVAPVTESNADDVEAWARIAAGEQQQIVLRDMSSPRSTPITLALDAGVLSDVLGLPVDPSAWGEADNVLLRQQIAEKEQAVLFLRHNTWQELALRPEFKLDVREEGGGQGYHSGSEATSFAALIDSTLLSDLARDLVRAGFITSHFALYASQFYGEYLGSDATEYVRRCIEPGVPDPTFALSETDVEQILIDQGAGADDRADLFSDPGVFNVSIVDYLIKHRPGAVPGVARRLARYDDLGRSFIDMYMAQGAQPAALLVALTPHWPDVLRFTVSTRVLEESGRVDALDAVLRAVVDQGVVVDGDVAQALEGNYRHMQAITNPSSAEHAERVMGVVQRSGAKLDSVEPLSQTARAAATTLRLFPITESNLLALLPDRPIGLDTLRSHASLYAYVLDKLSEYAHLAAARHGQLRVVVDPNAFVDVLRDAAEAPPAVMRQLIVSASAVCRVDDLSLVPPAAWPPLAAEYRTLPTFKNVAGYVDQFGIDTDLGALLRRRRKITDIEYASEPERTTLAIEMLAARDQIPSTTTRVQIANNLRLGTLAADQIKPESGDLVARLLRSKIIEDAPSAFSAELMVDWRTLESTIAASKKFSTFVSTDILAIDDLPALIRSESISARAKADVIALLPSFLVPAQWRKASKVAVALAEAGWKLPYETLEAFRLTGIACQHLINLIAAAGVDLDVPRLKNLLLAMGKDYARVSTGGRGKPTFPINPPHEIVLNRLVGDTVKKVEHETFKTHGPRLTARLM